MPDYSKIPWPRIHDFLVEVGSNNSPEQFLHNVYERIGDLIHGDLIIYSLASGGTIKEIFGVSKEQRNSFLEYYAQIVPAETIGLDSVDWEDYRHSEFVTGYIKPVGIRYSIGILLKGLPDKLIRFVVNRSPSSPAFDEYTEITIQILAPHLGNIFRCLDLIAGLHAENIKAAEVAAGCRILSKRESEVAALLCKRLSMGEIGTMLLISPRTVEKHITNIYEKLKVENRYELVLKLSKD